MVDEKSEAAGSLGPSGSEPPKPLPVPGQGEPLKKGGDTPETRPLPPPPPPQPAAPPPEQAMALPQVTMGERAYFQADRENAVMPKKVIQKLTKPPKEEK